MAKINLLPWREAYRREKKREFLVVLGGVVVIAVLLALLWILIVKSQIENQTIRNQILETEIASLEKQVSEISELKKKRDDLLSRIKVIQDLQVTRPFIVHSFDELARSIPEGIYLTSVSRKGEEFTIEGVSESLNRIASFMRTLDASEWFEESNLISVVSAPSEGEQAQSFKITIKASVPGETEEDKQKRLDGTAGDAKNNSSGKQGSKDSKSGGKK